MNLDLNMRLATSYKSGAQIARIISEAWALENLFCVACTRRSIEKMPPNTEAADFRCPGCAARYQLKATRRPIGAKVTDAGYAAMMRAVINGTFPHFLLMRYDTESARVQDLLLVPGFAVPPSAIVPRKPLGPAARRAGWVGCSIALNAVPGNGRISIVKESNIASISSVRDRFTSLRVLEEVPPIKRGWTLDILQIVNSLGRESFTLEDIYSYEYDLAKLHQQNRHIKPKIRQQLQVLRDLGLVAFLGRGVYQLRGSR